MGVDVMKKGLGFVTEADVHEAANASKVVYAFGVGPGPGVAELARDLGVEIRKYKIIYEVLDDIVAALNAMLKPTVELMHIGVFETAAIFRTENGHQIIGGSVKEGKVVSGEKARVWRGEEPMGDVEIESVQSGKQKVKEASSGTECGISTRGKLKIEVNDRLEIYHEEITERKVKIER